MQGQNRYLLIVRADNNVHHKCSQYGAEENHEVSCVIDWNARLGIERNAQVMYQWGVIPYHILESLDNIERLKPVISRILYAFRTGLLLEGVGSHIAIWKFMLQPVIP